MKEYKKESKLKKFVEKHEDALAIAGCAVGIAVGVGLIVYGCRMPTTINTKSLEKLAAKDKNVAKLLEICNAVDAGTAGTTIETLTKAVTVAEFFGEHAECFIDGSNYKLDDIVVNVIYNIAKKAET